MGKRIDILGMKFNKLTPLSLAYTKKQHQYWVCKCDCGNEKIICKTNLMTGNTQSCGCLLPQNSEGTRCKISESNKGKHYLKKSNEAKRKISEARKGMVFSEEHIKNLRLSHLGHIPSYETRLKLSAVRRREKNHMWNSNLTDADREKDRRFVIPLYNMWRTEVFKRDNFTCQKCGETKSGSFNAHHIESYRSNPELRTELSNGITFCKNCHDNFHHQYGYGNNTKEHLDLFLYNIKMEVQV